MIKNYFKTTIRNLLKHKSFSAINIAGLSVGLAGCLIIMRYVILELSYDQFHTKAARSYRMVLSGRLNDNDIEFPKVPAPMAAKLMAEFPEVETAARLRLLGNFTVRYGDRVFNEKKFFYADSTIFDVFTIGWLKGDQKTSLTRPNTVVITEEMARKYFGNDDPVGKSVKVDGRHLFEITGVCRPLPRNSHVHFDFLASMTTYEDSRNTEWLSNNYTTYVVLRDPTMLEGFLAKLDVVLRPLVSQQMQRLIGATLEQFEAGGGRYGYYAQPITDIHLHSHLNDEIEPNGHIAYVYIFSVVAFFILIIACVNFMNLTTARSAGRAKEVGVRKALGSHQSQLIHQFLLESVLLSLIAMILAVGLVEIALPFVATIAGQELSIDYLAHPMIIPSMVLMVVAVGLLAGSYPSLVLSGMKTATVLKGEPGSVVRHGWLRSGLVVFQFAISSALIIGTTVVFNQLNYMGTKELGFNKDQVLVVQNLWLLSHDKAKVFRHAVDRLSGVSSVSMTSGIPGSDIGNSGYLKEGGEQSDPKLLWNIRIDAAFIPTMDIRMAQGRNFSPEFVTDSQAVLINETAAGLLGLREPLGKRIIGFPDNKPAPYEIIGVIKDFHFQSLHQSIQPMVMHLAATREYLCIRLLGGSIPETIQRVESAWADISGGEPFVYSFLDNDLDALYRAETNIGRMFAVFAALAICIACLGLLGLAAYTAQQRTKEIGVRKVMGATVPGIMGLLTREFIRYVVIANLIAWPLAYFAMNRWLEGFAYRIDIGPGTFLLAGALALSVALLTVGWQAFRAARMNPVESLRYE